MTSSNHHHQSSSADNNLALITKLQSLPKAARNLLAGGLAGMIAKSFVAPIDRIKILYQVTSAQFRLRDVPRVAYSIIEKEGWAALWKGNTATMIRVFPYSGIQFMVFDYCKTHFLLKDKKSEQRQKQPQQQVEHVENKTALNNRTLSYADVAGKRSSANYNRQTTTLHHRGTIDNPHNTTTTATQHDNKVKGGLSPIDSLISGMAAGSVSVLCTYPLDLARAQLAVLRRKKKPKDKTSGTTSSTTSPSKLNLNKQLGIGSMKSSSKKGIGYVLSNGFEQGGVRGLYRGITPTLLGILPYSGTAFMINEQAKLRISHIMQREPTTIERLQCGALSGLFAQTLTYPLEVTRRRMQTIGIVPTSGSESASINFMGVSKIKPCVDELPSSSTSSSTTTNPSSQVPSTITATSASSSTTNATTTPSQLKSTTAHHHKPPSMITTMAHLLEEQGLRGFFKGVSMNWIKGPVAFSISFTAFDTIQGWIEMESEKEERHRLTNRSSTKKMMERRMTNHLERRITNPQDED